jgi:hypothetical protein
MYEFSKKTKARLDQCEANIRAPFTHIMERRRMHENTLCRGAGLTTMLKACCPSQGGNVGHRRFMQDFHGCDTLPAATCPTACLPVFIEYCEGVRVFLED